MPEGASRFFWTGWVNATGRSGQWATYVARDVVHAVDARFRTIRSEAGRGIGGFSAGAYGALDIALHHPHEFRLIESWSGYMHADDSAAVLGGQAMLARNSPAWLAAHEAPLLRRLHSFIWFYVGATDKYAPQNRAFAAELARLRIAHRSFERPGGHSWSLWRHETAAALVAASRRLAHA
jgi:S-formylglutathione hydrolase FrmB